MKLFVIRLAVPLSIVINQSYGWVIAITGLRGPMREERIDSHHHLWKYSRADYPWISEDMKSIRQDFLIPDIAQAMQAAKIDGVVTVQARQSLIETDWLLDLASQHDFMRGVVGWVPLADPAVASHLEKYWQYPKLKAVRHVLHDEPDDFYMLREDFNQGVSQLEDVGLRYDILIFERHLPQTIEFVDRHPTQVFILDHIAKPKSKPRLFRHGGKNCRNLVAGRTAIAKCKGS